MTRSAAQRNVGQYFAAAFLLGASTFALAYKPTDEAVSQLKPQEARRQIADLLKARFVTAVRASSVLSVAFTTERMELHIQGEPQARVYWFKEMPALEATNSIMNVGPSVAIGKGRDDSLFTFGSRGAPAERLADALHRLKLESMRATDPSAEAAFAEAAGQYRAANPKPEFPEEARRLRVPAEAFVRDKRWVDAADLYGEALRVVPWWPEGRFNRALLLGEMSDYRSAVREMKRYLMLVPDALNARDAQDRIYEWEAKATH